MPKIINAISNYEVPVLIEYLEASIEQLSNIYSQNIDGGCFFTDDQLNSLTAICKFHAHKLFKNVNFIMDSHDIDLIQLKEISSFSLDIINVLEIVPHSELSDQILLSFIYSLSSLCEQMKININQAFELIK